MPIYVRTILLLASSNLFAISDFTDEDCGEVQYNAENGMIRLPDFSAVTTKNINCSWTYIASSGRKLLVKVDSVHLPPSEVRSSSFQLYIDDHIYDIPRNCVKCLRDIVGGKTIKVFFSSILFHSTESSVFLTNQSDENTLDNIGSFQVRYKSYDPYRCSKPEQIENGSITSKGRKVGQSVFYRCNPPFEIFGETESQCRISKESPVPEWSSKPPKCALQDCNNGPVLRESGSGSIASPGYPSFTHEFNSVCEWIVIAKPNQQIKASVTYLHLPSFVSDAYSDYNTSRLSLIDGGSSYTVNLTETILNNSFNFTTLSNKLIVKFFVNNNRKNSKDIGFYLDYSSVSNSCPVPQPPVNGEVVDYSNELGSIISYRCDPGYVLVGEHQAECLLDGQWTHPSPLCESLSVDSSGFIGSSNSSDIIKFMEFPKYTDPALRTNSSKIPKNGKKKAKDFLITKSFFSDFKTQAPELTPSENFISSEKESVKMTTKGTGLERKEEKENGPKSEPHLLQVIPPKTNTKKSSVNLSPVDIGKGSKSNNISQNEEYLPHPEIEKTLDKINKYHSILSVTMISIIAGVGAPLLVAVILLLSILIYRKRYPVRMNFGRKFSTFENPMYVTKDAQHPRELKRLTT